MKQLVCLDGIMRMGMYLITNLVSFYSFQTSDGFVMTTKYQIMKIFFTKYLLLLSTKALRALPLLRHQRPAQIERLFLYFYLIDKLQIYLMCFHPMILPFTHTCERRKCDLNQGSST